VAIREQDGTYAIACSSLGVYTTGKTLAEAKRNFKEALDLHLSVLREKAIEAAMHKEFKGCPGTSGN
jgi:predicted RNase H-like HicB family nuclease